MAAIADIECRAECHSAVGQRGGDTACPLVVHAVACGLHVCSPHRLACAVDNGASVVGAALICHVNGEISVELAKGLTLLGIHVDGVIAGREAVDIDLTALEAFGKREHLVVVFREIKAEIPLEFVGLDGGGVEHELDTTVAHLTEVDHLGRETCGGIDREGEDLVLGNAVVV